MLHRRTDSDVEREALEARAARRQQLLMEQQPREVAALQRQSHGQSSMRSADSGVQPDEEEGSSQDEYAAKRELFRRRKRLSCGRLGRSLPALNLACLGSGGSGASETDEDATPVRKESNLQRNRSLYVSSGGRRRLSTKLSPNGSPRMQRSPLMGRRSQNPLVPGAGSQALGSRGSSFGKSDHSRSSSFGKFDQREPPPRAPPGGPTGSSTTAAAATAGPNSLLADQTLPASPTPHDRERIEAHFQRAGSRMSSMRSRTGSTRVRARSLSPTRRDELPRQASFFKGRLAKSLATMTDGIQALLGSINEPRADGSHETGYIFEQLNLISRDILHTARANEVNNAYFRATTDSLGKLLKLCTAGDLNVNRIKKLLLLISRPARLLECLDSSVSSDLRLKQQLDDQRNREQLVVITSDNQHMPGYILSKLTTHFGSMSNPSSRVGTLTKGFTPALGGDGPDAAAPAASFLTLGRKPVKSDFNFLKLLSSGAYGSVYLAQHRESHESFAIKCLRKRDMANKNLVNQVMAERDILQFAHNPFVIQFICSFTTKDALYIVMEYAPGGDLATYLKNMGSMSEREARRYFAETVLAVEYIHEFGIVHRDLKPDNLIISRDGHIKLTDFGLSKIGLMNRTTLLVEEPRPNELALPGSHDVSLVGANGSPAAAAAAADGRRRPTHHRSYSSTSSTFAGAAPSSTAATASPGAGSTAAAPPGDARQHYQNSTVLGTPDYIAPEVIMGQGYGQAVDWWAMGIILYEFLYGVPPFMGDTVEELFFKTVNNDVEFPPNEGDLQVSRHAQDLILGLLDKDPAMRLGTPQVEDDYEYEYEEGAPNGADDVKEHSFFAITIEDEDGINWDELLQEKACFVPDLDDDLDTSYFDDRQDRYHPRRASTSSEDNSPSDSDDDAKTSTIDRRRTRSERRPKGDRPNLGLFRNFSAINLSTTGPAGSSVGSLTPRRRKSITDVMDDAVFSPSPSTSRQNSFSEAKAPAPPPANHFVATECESPTPQISVSPPSTRHSRMLDPLFMVSSAAPVARASTPPPRRSVSMILDPIFTSTPPAAPAAAAAATRTPPPPLRLDLADRAPSPPATPPSPSMVPAGTLRRRTLRRPSPHADAAVHSPLRPRDSMLLMQAPPMLTKQASDKAMVTSPTPLSGGMLSGPVSPPAGPSPTPLGELPTRSSQPKLRPDPLCCLGCAKCMIVRIEWSAQHGFGFGIRTMRTPFGNRHRVVHVDAGGPAEQAGMTTHYAVIQVNGNTIQSTDSHQKVARLINQFRGCTTAFHLLDISSELKSTKKGLGTRSALFKRIANSFSRDPSKAKKSRPPTKPDLATGLVLAGSSPLMAVGEPRWDWLSRFTRSPSARASPTRSDSGRERRDSAGSMGLPAGASSPGSSGTGGGNSFISSLKRSMSHRRRKDQQTPAPSTPTPVISAPEELTHLAHGDAHDLDDEFVRMTHERSTDLLRSDSLRSAGSTASFRSNSDRPPSTPIIPSPLRSPAPQSSPPPSPGWDSSASSTSGATRVQHLDDALGRSPSPMGRSWLFGSRQSLDAPPNSPVVQRSHHESPQRHTPRSSTPSSATPPTTGSAGAPVRAATDSPLFRSPPMHRRSPLASSATAVSPVASPPRSPKVLRAIMQRAAALEAQTAPRNRRRQSGAAQALSSGARVTSLDDAPPPSTPPARLERLRSFETVLAMADQSFSASASRKSSTSSTTSDPSRLMPPPPRPITVVAHHARRTPSPLAGIHDTVV